LNKIKHAVAQKYLSYCRQIPYDSIIPINRFSIFLQIAVTDFSYRHDFLTTHDERHLVMQDVILFMNKMLSKEDRVLIKVLRVEKGYSAKNND